MRSSKSVGTKPKIVKYDPAVALERSERSRRRVIHLSILATALAIRHSVLHVQYLRFMKTQIIVSTLCGLVDGIAKQNNIVNVFTSSQTVVITALIAVIAAFMSYYKFPERMTAITEHKAFVLATQRKYLSAREISDDLHNDYAEAVTNMATCTLPTELKRDIDKSIKLLKHDAKMRLARVKVEDALLKLDEETVSGSRKRRNSSVTASEILGDACASTDTPSDGIESKDEAAAELVPLPSTIEATESDLLKSLRLAADDLDAGHSDSDEGEIELVEAQGSDDENGGETKETSSGP